MPLVLENSHNHSFSYVDENGVTQDANVTKGQDIEPLNLPQNVLIKLMTEVVPRFTGERHIMVPRYTQKDTVSDQTYSRGTVTTRKANIESKPSGVAPKVDADEMMKKLREVEQQVYAETSGETVNVAASVEVRPFEDPMGDNQSPLADLKGVKAAEVLDTLTAEELQGVVAHEARKGLRDAAVAKLSTM